MIKRNKIKKTETITKSFPTKLYIEKTEDSYTLGKILSNQAYKRIFFCHSKSFIKGNESCNKFIKEINSCPFQIKEIVFDDDVIDLRLLEETMAEFRIFQPDVILAVGSKEVIYFAKCVANMAYYFGKFKDLCDPDFPRTNVFDLVVVPTNLLSSAALCDFTFIRDFNKNKAYYLKHEFCYPKFAYLNPSLIHIKSEDLSKSIFYIFSEVLLNSLSNQDNLIFFNLLKSIKEIDLDKYLLGSSKSKIDFLNLVYSFHIQNRLLNLFENNPLIKFCMKLIGYDTTLPLECAIAYCLSSFIKSHYRMSSSYFISLNSLLFNDEFQSVNFLKNLESYFYDDLKIANLKEYPKAREIIEEIEADIALL